MPLERFESLYAGRKVLITGHTGFTGSWLSLWLGLCGAEVHGIALPPLTTPNLYDGAALDSLVAGTMLDILHLEKLKAAVRTAAPEIVFHLAAQPLVRRSYREPVETFAVNVMGTVNVLEACRAASTVNAVVSITTDKVYDNRNWLWSYREDDRLGAADPYSTSKACAELVATGYRATLLGDEVALATARGGNIVGGGDWSEDRLVPDIVRAIDSGNELLIRNPHATRPWQHVLSVCHAYMTLGAELLEQGHAMAQAWNFGPEVKDAISVGALVDLFSTAWTPVPVSIEQAQLHEAQALSLDSTKANEMLRWRSPWNIDRTVNKTVEWYREYYADPGRARELMQQQIDAYRADLKLAAAAV